MARYLVRRLVQTIPLLILISMLQFGLLVGAPGGPVKAYLLEPTISAEDIAALEHQLGLDRPLPVQYIAWLKNVLRGDLGRSYFTHRPVLESVLERLPATLWLGLAATIVSYSIGLPLGIYAGLHRGSLADHLFRVGTAVLNAVPHWWLGLLLIVLITNIKLATGVQILPIAGMTTLGADRIDIVDLLRHTVLPAAMLGTGGWVTIGRFLRSETLEVLSQDYVRTARAKGLGERAVTVRHVLRNALIPVITLSSGVFVGLVGGAVIYEHVFSWPGMGRLLYEATMKKDYPVAIGVGFMLTILAVLGRLAADVAYSVADPRIRYD